MKFEMKNVVYCFYNLRDTVIVIEDG